MKSTAVPVAEIIRSLEGEAANTDTDPRWRAAKCLREISGWESRQVFCRLPQEATVARLHPSTSKLSRVSEAAERLVAEVKASGQGQLMASVDGFIVHVVEPFTNSEHSPDSERPHEPAPAGEIPAATLDLVLAHEEAVRKDARSSDKYSLQEVRECRLAVLSEITSLARCLFQIQEAAKALAKAPVEPSQPSEATECRDCTQIIQERDDYHEWADTLAHDIERLVGVEIGEHSSGNAPWGNAHDAAEYELDKRARQPHEPAEATGIYDSAWVIEGMWSSTAYPEYWVGSSAWSSDPYKALRFASKESAQQAADMMLVGINHRIACHEFFMEHQQ